MTMRVATFAMTDRLLDTALRTQAKTAELQIQQASGLISDDYGGLGGYAKDVVSLETSITRAQAYIDSATSARNRIEIMYSACGSMVDLLSTMRSQLTSAMGSLENDVTSLQSAAAEILEEFSSLLNTQYEGRYLFAGGQTDSPAVDTSDATYAAASSPSSVDTSYYLGDSDIASVRTSSDQIIQYGVTADNSAFEKSLRALNLLKNMSVDPVDSAVLEEAQALIVDGLDGVLAVQTGLSLDEAAMERAIDTQEDYVAYGSSRVSDLRDVDVAAVAASLATYEAQLQASYSALGRIQKLSLLNYI
jgi:flagellar hook-associated protein 3 FlgL